MNSTLAQRWFPASFGALFVIVSSLAPASAPARGWGPPRKSVVNEFVGVTLASSGVTTVYVVPPDRWLTLTAASFSASTPSTLFWSELYQGATQKRGYVVGPSSTTNVIATLLPSLSPTPGGAAVGWVFRPGSSVVIEGGNGAAGTLALIGYLSED